MKTFKSILLISILLISFSWSVSAHPGRTDGNGGHYNRSTGEYHYHHGYPEHQHPNGICPYDFDDKTGQNSGSSSFSSSSTTYSYNGEDASKEGNKFWYEKYYDAESSYEKTLKERNDLQNEISKLKDNHKSDKQATKFLAAVSISLFFVSFLFLFLFAINKNKNKNLTEETKKLSREVKNLASKLSESIESSKNDEEHYCLEISELKKQHSLEISELKKQHSLNIASIEQSYESQLSIFEKLMKTNRERLKPLEEQNRQLNRCIELQNRTKQNLKMRITALLAKPGNEELAKLEKECRFYKLLLSRCEKRNIHEILPAIPYDTFFVKVKGVLLPSDSRSGAYGSYTLYTCEHGKAKHSSSLCSGGFYDSIHCLHSSGKSPCLKCYRENEKQANLKRWYPDFVALQEVFKKYSLHIDYSAVEKKEALSFEPIDLSFILSAQKLPSEEWIEEEIVFPDEK